MKCLRIPFRNQKYTQKCSYGTKTMMMMIFWYGLGAPIFTE